MVQGVKAKAKRLQRWLAFTSAYEEAITQIAEEIYRCYKRDQLTDNTLIELCITMEDIFKQSQRWSKEMQEELEASAGGIPLMNKLSKAYVNNNVRSYKSVVGGAIQDVSSRAMGLAEARIPFCQSSEPARMCRRAARLRECADQVWQEMVEANLGHNGQRMTALEHILMLIDKISPRLLANQKVRGAIGKMAKYSPTVKEHILRDEVKEEPKQDDDPSPEALGVTPSRLPPPRIENDRGWLGDR